MSSYRVISSDNHVIEPADLWTSRAESRFKDRVPHVEYTGLSGPGTPWIERSEDEVWVCDGRIMSHVGGGSADVGVRFEDPSKLGTKKRRMEEARSGGYIPEEHVKDLDIDGIDVSIVYPTTGGVLYNVPDSELLSLICRLYNDWVGEFCSAVPKRLKGIAMLNVDVVQEGVKELERCAKMGLVGGMITVYPPEDRLYDKPEYEPLWAAAQDLGMPLGLHLGSNRSAGELWYRPTYYINVDHWVRMSLSEIILSGVFERYPKLQVGSVEHELSWAPHFLDRLDYTYTQRSPFPSTGYRFKGDVLPSDYFHNNVFLGFQEDALGIRDRHIIGVDNLQWGADYPHAESTFPRSRQIIEEILADCTEEEKAKIVGGNAERIYRLD